METRFPSGCNGSRNPASNNWNCLYAERHKFIPLKHFPAGVEPPVKVRIYRRHEHFILQWWDPAAKRNLSERENGDLVSAISRARVIDARIVHFKTSGFNRPKRMGHSGLVSAFLNDLQKRADAAEVAPRTVKRYNAALAHYLAFSQTPSINKMYSGPARVDREFRLQLEAFLAQRQVTVNGRMSAETQRMKSKDFVMDTIRAMFEWASDPVRGSVMPEGFRNPFLRSHGFRSPVMADPLAQPDITLPMAVDLIQACDQYQLRLFVPILLFGLRATEPVFLFAEHLEGAWLRVPCLEELGYLTKGHRDKRFPLVIELASFWQLFSDSKAKGLILTRRSVCEGRSKPPLFGSSLADLIEKFRAQTASASVQGASARLAIRNRLIQDAGGLTYDLIQEEFHVVARKLQWPRSATLKDLRHLFATTMNNASMPEPYRRYLMGHSQGRAAIGAYTHLNELERHYQEAVRKEWSPLIEAIQNRTSLLAKAS